MKHVRKKEHREPLVIVNGYENHSSARNVKQRLGRWVSTTSSEQQGHGSIIVSCRVNVTKLTLHLRENMYEESREREREQERESKLWPWCL